MPFLENATDYSEDDQLTAANLNALTESAKPVKAGSGVTNSGNTTDETSCNINGSGEIEVKDGGVSTAKIADSAVTNAKLAPTSGTAAVSGSASGATGTNVIEAASIGLADIANNAISADKLQDGAVASGKLAITAMTGLAELTDAPADEDEFWINDGGTLKRIGWDTILEHAAIPKAYGIVTWDGSAAEGTDNFKISGVSDQTSPTRVRVTLDVTMSGTDYQVTATGYNNINGSVLPVGIYAKTTTTFDLIMDNVQASGLAINFAVFGTLA